MRNWEQPVIEEVKFTETANGAGITLQADDDWVTINGKYMQKLS